MEKDYSRFPAFPRDDFDIDLTTRELAILEYLTAGASNKLIARYLGIADATVKVNVKTILRKIKASNRTEAAAWAIRHNIGVKPEAVRRPAVETPGLAFPHPAAAAE